MALVIGALMALAAVVLVSGAEPDRPVAVVGHAGALGTVAHPTTTTRPTAPTTTTTGPKAAPSRSTTVVRTDAGGVTVVNSGSESVNTGNNTVIGPGSATVTNGPANAAGNSSTVRVGPP